MTLKPLALFIAAFLLIATSVALCFKADDTDFTLAKKIIVMRNIGHEVLLSSGDSSSRVLPVDITGENQYLIRFENAFQFTPDSIVRIIRQAVENYKLPSDYIVNVIECESDQVIYGFGVLKSEQTDVVACKGRTQPKTCYSIKITFRDTDLSAKKKDYLLGAGGGLTALMLILSGLRISARQKRSSGGSEKPTLAAADVILIGNYQFYTDHRYLEYDEEQIELSDKESKVLFLLARNPNQLVERADLQKVWEDEGVIVGRSLDMFISKLRKKLEHDLNVRLVNVHGKGYKLEVNKVS
jgi:DNA-binding winged helix-turn-helix (wHTH) protein